MIFVSQCALWSYTIFCELNVNFNNIINNIIFKKMFFLLLYVGAEPSQFNWSVPKKTQKPPAVRVPVATVTTQEESCEVEEEFFGPEVQPSVSTVNTASPSPAREESDVLKLQWEIEQLKVELADFKVKLIEVEKEREILLARQFSLDKIKDDDSAVLFYTRFPNYAALRLLQFH